MTKRTNNLDKRDLWKYLKDIHPDCYYDNLYNKLKLFLKLFYIHSDKNRSVIVKFNLIEKQNTDELALGHCLLLEVPGPKSFRPVFSNCCVYSQT